VAALRTAVVSAAKNATSNVVDVSDLGELQQQAIARGRLSRLEAAELEQLRHALAEARGNRVRAAELLEIGRSTLYRKIDSYTRRGYDLGG
jgi:sigma-54 dependent transcriptional regulator, acetoin dehydrogenase operon transcriptional activator AcoR